MKTMKSVLIVLSVLLVSSGAFAQGFSALLSNFSVPLYDTCDAGVTARELPDGVTVEIVHDVDLDGADWTDPLATVCTEPPDCPTGPTGTVNYNSFPLNGQSWGVNGGMFYASSAFTSSADLPSPNRFYLRICVEIEPGHPVYYIATQGHNGGGPLTNFSPPSGPSEWEFDTWTCTNGICEGGCSGRTAIQGFTASDSSCGFVGLSWTAYTDTVQVDSLFITRNGNLIKTVYRTATSAYDSTATVGTTYTYSISSRRVCGPGNYGWSPLANDLGQARSAPPVPTSMSASDGTCGLVTVTWSVPTTAGADSFHVFRNDTLIHRMLRTGGVGPFNYVHTTANGATATYKVKSVSLLCGPGNAASDPGTALQAPTAVATSVNATDGQCNSVVVTWVDVPTGVTSYVIYRQPDAGGTTDSIGQVNQGVQTFTTTTGTAYTVYRYSLKAKNSCGRSANSSAYDTGYFNTVPSQVTGVTATVDSFCTHVRINWNNAANETGYNIYRPSTTLIGTVGADVTTYNDSTAAQGTTYSYYVKAFNACGEGTLSSSASGRRKAVPAQVTGVVASDSSTLYCWGVRVQWTLITADSFQIRRNGSRIGVALSGVNFFNDSTAVRGDTAAYSVVAYNSCGAGTPSITNQGSRKALPGAVTGLFASDTSCSQIFLKWNNVIREDSFRILRDGSFLATTVANDTDYVDLTATGGSSYDYRVVAANRCGNGDTTAVVTGRRLAALPAVTNVQATNDDCEQIVVTWDNIADEDSFVVKRNGTQIGVVPADVTQLIDETVEPWTNYGYTVTAYNDCGAGAEAAADTGMAATVPVLPYMYASDDICDHVFIGWQSIEHVDSFFVYRNGSRIGGQIGFIQYIYDTTAVPGERYQYTVSGWNALCGEGAAAPADSGGRLIFPTVPQNLSATDELCDRIDLTWDAATGDADWIYIYRDAVLMDSVAGTETTYSDDVEPGIYDYTVSAKSDQCGETEVSTADSGERLANAGQVLNVTATRTRCDSIIVTWDAATGDVDGYVIFVGGGYLDSLDGTTLTYGYVPGEPGAFTYTVQAYSEQCGNGVISDNESGVLLAYPTTVTGLTATTDRCDGVELEWNEATGSVDGYIIRRGGVNIDTVEAVFRTLTYFDDEAPLGDAEYDVVAYSENCGDAAASAPATGTVLPYPTAPSDLAATTDRCDSVIVTWTASTGTFDMYKIYRDGVLRDSVLPPTTRYAGAPTSGQTYRYTVIAWDDVCGPSDSTAGVNGLRQADAGIPQNLTAEGDCDGINLTWNASTGVPVGYILYRGLDNATLAYLDSLPPTDTTYADDTVERGISYYYAVSAYTFGCGETDTSNHATSLRLPLLTAVTGVAATNDDCDGILVTWDALVGSDRYRIYRDGVFLDSIAAAPNPSYLDTNVAPGASHYYKIAARNICGEGEQSADSAVGMRYDVPELVTGLAASDTSCVAIYLVWTDVATETGYIVYRDGNPIDTVDADVTEYADAAASPGDHDYVVYAINECGLSLVSETADGYKIPGVGQVTMPWASRNYCGTINVSWLDNFDNEDGFRVYRDGAFLGEVAANEQSYTDATVDPGSYHWYRIAAYNVCGEGMLSDSVEGYRWAVPPQVMTLTATRDSCTSITLTWSDLATESYYIIVRDGVNIDSTEADANDTTYRDEGLNPGLYDYWVYARNHCGDGLSSDTVEGQVADVPGVAANLQATMDHCTTVTVTWDDLPDELNYEVLRDGASLVVLGQNAVSYVDNPTIGTHAYAVIASNICGIGDTTDAVTGERQGPPTVMPVITVPDEACDTVHFCWTAATDITGYHIFRNGAQYANVTPEHLCWWDLNQGGNTTVGYAVQPYNECGDGPMSAADSVRFLPTVLQPTGLTATTTNCVTVTLHWNDNPNEEGYYILRDNVQIAEVAQNVVDYIDSPAEPDTFIYRVKAFNDCGASSASDSAVGIRRGPPAMVTGVNASDTLCNQITITWNDVADEDSFQVRRNGERIGMTIPNVTTFNDMEATPGSTYAYTVVAFNNCGMSTISAPDNGYRATIPVQVTGVAATINRCDSVIVTWTDVATETSYWIYRNGAQVGTRPQNATRYADAPEPGTYQYQVRAVNTCGLGDTSAAVTGTRQTLPLPPVITAGPESCMVVTIFPASGGGDVDRFRIYRDTVLIDSIDASAESWNETIAGIHQYYFTAYNADCGAASAPSNTLQLTGHEPAFPPPSITFVEPARCDSIRLTWPDGSGEVEGYVIRRDGDSIGTTTERFYTDLGIDDTEDHEYAVASFNPWCGTGDFTQPVTGSILPLIEPVADLPETLACRDTLAVYFTHCAGVQSDSLFFSLNGGPFEYLAHMSPVQDSIVIVVPTVENQIYTPNCRAMILSRRGTRIDTLYSDPIVIYCDLAAEELTGADIPRDFMLDQNYPNPFNPSTTVRFGVPKAAEVKIEIYNITGQHVATLLEGTYQPGWHKVVWDCAACPTGMYIMRMQTNEKVLLRKMLLMK